MNAPTRFEDYIDRVRPATASNMLLGRRPPSSSSSSSGAGFTQLDRTVRGGGRISPASRLQVVSNLEGGIVEAILVKTGVEVRRGDPLVRLDRTATGSVLSSNQAQYDAMTARIARLEGRSERPRAGFPPAIGAADSGMAEQVGNRAGALSFAHGRSGQPVGRRRCARGAEPPGCRRSGGRAGLSAARR